MMNCRLMKFLIPVKENANFMERIISDEIKRVYGFNMETKTVFSKKKALQSRLNMKVMLMVFLTLMVFMNSYLRHKQWITGIIWKCWNIFWYSAGSAKSVRRIKSELWRNKFWFLYHGTAHTLLLIHDFLAKIHN